MELVRLFLALALVICYKPDIAEGCLCHVIPNFQCPPPPHCCESGQYTHDECGCCLTCAKAELQPCGGPAGDHGKCAQGLGCLKTCSKYRKCIGEVTWFCLHFTSFSCLLDHRIRQGTMRVSILLQWRRVWPVHVSWRGWGRCLVRHWSTWQWHSHWRSMGRLCWRMPWNQ